jgi:hypothetical protein
MSDRIMAVLALAMMIASLAVGAVFAPDIDLIIVIILVSAMAIYDFWQTLRAKHLTVIGECLMATFNFAMAQTSRSRGSRPAMMASRLSSALNPIASRVSRVALPM